MLLYETIWLIPFHNDLLIQTNLKLPLALFTANGIIGYRGKTFTERFTARINSMLFPLML